MQTTIGPSRYDGQCSIFKIAQRQCLCTDSAWFRRNGEWGYRAPALEDRGVVERGDSRVVEGFRSRRSVLSSNEGALEQDCNQKKEKGEVENRIYARIGRHVEAIAVDLRVLERDTGLLERRDQGSKGRKGK